MPRINGIMQPLPNVYGTPGRPIESAKYNTQLDDLIADANTPRPITAGGTGTTNVRDARAAFNVMQNLDAFTTGGAPQESNWNAFDEPGPIPRLMHATSAAGNAPRLNQFFYGIVLRFGGNVTQLAFPYLGDQSGAFWRVRFGVEWSAWKAVTSAADIGLGNVANKTEAQMVAAGAIADALAGKAAANHTHTVSQISDGGAAGRAVVQQATVAAIRSYLGLAVPATYSSSMGQQTLNTSAYPLASVDFVAAGQSVTATGLMQITAGGTIYGYCRVQLSLVSGGGGNFGSSVENPTIIATNDFKTLVACEVFTGLSIGSTYRAQVFGRTNDGFATCPASFIRALNL